MRRHESCSRMQQTDFYVSEAFMHPHGSWKARYKSKGLIGKFPSVTAVYMVGSSTWVYPTTCLQVHPSLHFIHFGICSSLKWACTYRISSWFVVHCCSSVSRQTTKRWQQWQKTVHDTNVRRYHVHRIKKIIHVCLYLHCSWRNAACFGSWEEVEHAKVCSLVRLGCLWAWKGAHTLLGWWPLFCMQGCVTQACLKIACCVEDFNYPALWIIARNVPLGIFAVHWTTGEWCWQGYKFKEIIYWKQKGCAPFESSKIAVDCNLDCAQLCKPENECRRFQASKYCLP